MKSRLLAAVAAAALVAPGVASAQDSWYGRVGLGYGTTQNMDLVEAPTTRFGPFQIQSGGHLTPQLALGYETGTGLRAEFETGYMYDDTGAVGNYPFSKSSIQTYSFLLNAIYDFDAGFGGVTPFLGAGVGLLRQRLSATAPEITPPAPGFLTGQPAYVVDDTDWTPAAQFLAGVRFPTGSNLSTEVRYRWLAALRRSKFDDSLYGGNVYLEDYSSHDIVASLIWSFGATAAPPPPPPPPPPAPPPPPPPPPAPAACENVEFVVYFEWDRSNITDQARSVIQQAADRARQCGIANVQIDGHADRSGSASYNVGLSQRRADAVRQTLVQLGVGNDSIRTEAFGESRPAVPTPDGVREPLNRRAEVIIRVSGAGS